MSEPQRKHAPQIQPNWDLKKTKQNRNILLRHTVIDIFIKFKRYCNLYFSYKTTVVLVQLHSNLGNRHNIKTNTWEQCFLVHITTGIFCTLSPVETAKHSSDLSIKVLFPAIRSQKFEICPRHLPMQKREKKLYKYQEAAAWKELIEQHLQTLHYNLIHFTSSLGQRNRCYVHISLLFSTFKPNLWLVHFIPQLQANKSLPSQYQEIYE